MIGNGNGHFKMIGIAPHTFQDQFLPGVIEQHVKFLVCLQGLQKQIGLIMNAQGINGI